MADPLSIVASIAGIAAAGAKVSLSLYNLAETVKTAGKRVCFIASDIESTCGVLRQIKDLIDPKTLPDGTQISFFTKDALRDISHALSRCEHIFEETRSYLARASSQVANIKKTSSASGRAGPPPLHANIASLHRRDSRIERTSDYKIQLSPAERAKWPFLQPQCDELRADLRDAKSNLLLMVAVAQLALTHRAGMGVSMGRVVGEKEEEQELKATIVRLRRRTTLEMSNAEDGRGREKKANVGKGKETGLRQLILGIKKFFGGQEVPDGKGGKHEVKSFRSLAMLDATGKSGGGNRSQQGLRIPSMQPHARLSTEKSPPKPHSAGLPHDTSHTEDGNLPPILKHRDQAGHEGMKADTVSQKGSIHKISSDLSNEETDKQMIGETGHSGGSKDAKSQKGSFNSIGPGSGNYGADKPITYAPGTFSVEDVTYPRPKSYASSRTSAVESAREARLNNRPVTPKLPKKKPPAHENDLSPIEVWVEEWPESPSSLPPELVPLPSSPKIIASVSRATSPQPAPFHSLRYHAWTTDALTGLHSGLSRSVTIHEIMLSDEDLAKIVNVKAREDMLASLNKLNMYQRRLVLSHVGQIDSVLVHFEVCEKDRVSTVFGEHDVERLLWVTTRDDEEEVVFDREEFFGTRDEIASLMAQRHKDKSMAERKAEAEMRRTMVAEKRAIREIEEKRQMEWSRSRTREKRDDKAHPGLDRETEDERMLRVRRELEEEKLRKERDNYLNGDEPIKFQILDRTFAFPFRFAKKWEVLITLIKDATAIDPALYPRIDDGQFDIMGPNGEVILPALWESLVRPGLHLSLKLWPAPLFSQPPPPPPPPPPPLPLPHQAYAPTNSQPYQPAYQTYASTTSQSYQPAHHTVTVSPVQPYASKLRERSRRPYSTPKPDSEAEEELNSDSDSLTSSGNGSHANFKEPSRLNRFKRSLLPTRKATPFIMRRHQQSRDPKVKRTVRIQEPESSPIPALEYRPTMDSIRNEDMALVRYGSEEEESRGEELDISDEHMVNELMSKWIQDADSKDENTEATQLKGKEEDGEDVEVTKPRGKEKDGED